MKKTCDRRLAPPQVISLLSQSVVTGRDDPDAGHPVSNYLIQLSDLASILLTWNTPLASR